MLNYEDLKVGQVYIGYANIRNERYRPNTKVLMYVPDSYENRDSINKESSYYNPKKVLVMVEEFDKEHSNNTKEIMDKINNKIELDNHNRRYMKNYWSGGYYVYRFDVECNCIDTKRSNRSVL